MQTIVSSSVLKSCEVQQQKGKDSLNMTEGVKASSLGVIIFELTLGG